MDASLDLSTLVLLREVKASLASPPPVQVAGKRKLSQIRLRRSLVSKVEVHRALRCRRETLNLLGFGYLGWFRWNRCGGSCH